MTASNKPKYDKYYTKSHISSSCIEFFVEHIQIDNNDIVIEPSAGNGAFSKHLFKLFKNVFAYDILPEHEDIIEQDFLSLNIPQKWTKNSIHIIGNPPFGKQSSLVRQFIRKCCLFVDSIGFILPNSFKKIYAQRIFPPTFHLVSEMDIPPNSFTSSDSTITYNISCTFQVWKRDTCHAPRIISKSFSKFFTFTNRTNADFSIRRVGVNVGRISKDVNQNTTTHYFIKLLPSIPLNYFFELFNTLTFPTDTSVGPPYINKYELIHITNKLNILY